jgi:hypothetical protein
MSNHANFPFEKINPTDLLIGETYYISLDEKIKEKYKRNKIVSRLKGTFVSLYTEQGKQTESNIEYAIFNNIAIINNDFKPGSCTMMLIRDPETNELVNEGCDTYSINNKNSKIIINENREVYFNINRWIFGLPTENTLLQKQVVKKLKTDLFRDIDQELGKFTARGYKTTTRSKSKRRKTFAKKRIIHKRRKTKKTKKKTKKNNKQ